MDPNYLSHLLQQITSSLDALQRAQLVSDTDLNLIKSRLPTPDGRPAPPQLALTTGAGLGTVTAEWEYRSENAEDLHFAKGDRIVLLEESSAEWWLGSLNGRTGIFPSNYVRRDPAGPPLAPRDTHPNATAPPYNDSNQYAPPSAPHPQQQQQQWQQPGPSQPYYQQPPQPYNQYAPPPNQYQPPPSQAYYPQQMQPYQPQYQQPYPDQKPEYGQMVPQQQAQPPVQATPPPPPAVPEKKPSKLGGFGKIMATSAAGGLGFGAGSAVGSGIIHSIF